MTTATMVNSLSNQCDLFDLHYLIDLLIDIAVGAPYDGEDESGIVYIFRGTSDGINLVPDQVNFILTFVSQIKLLIECKF